MASEGKKEAAIRETRQILGEAEKLIFDMRAKLKRNEPDEREYIATGTDKLKELMARAGKNCEEIFRDFD